MPLDLTRIGGASVGIEVASVERDRTPTVAMQLGIRLDLSGLSLGWAVLVPAAPGIDRSQAAVDNWRNGAGLESAAGRHLRMVALNGTVVKIQLGTLLVVSGG